MTLDDEPGDRIRTTPALMHTRNADTGTPRLQRQSDVGQAANPPRRPG